MKNKALLLGKKFLKQELVNGSIYIFVGSMIANIFNFLFNLFMSRNLSVEQYGILTSTIALIMVITIPVGSILPTMVNFAGSRFAKEDYGSVKAFFVKIIKPLLFVSFILLFCFIVFARNIGDFFQISDQSLIIIAGLIVAMAHVGIVNSGLLQAKLAFKFISFSNLTASFIKLLVGVFLVFLGFNVKGAMLALFLSGVIPFVVSFVYLRNIFKSQSKNLNNINFKNLLSYGIPSSLATLGMTSLISTDMILVKHFYDPLQAGVYAGLSLVGKVIFFFSAPITSVMFPLIIKKHAKKENYNNIFRMALVMVFIPSVLISIFYFLYPDLSISFFIKNKTYLSVSSLLGLFGIFITMYSLISLFVYYFLSVNKTRVYIPVVFSAIAQAVLITFYHDSLFEAVIISLVISAILLLTLLFYYIKTHGEHRKIKESIIIGDRLNDV